MAEHDRARADTTQKGNPNEPRLFTAVLRFVGMRKGSRTANAGDPVAWTGSQ